MINRWRISATLPRISDLYSLWSPTPASSCKCPWLKTLWTNFPCPQTFTLHGVEFLRLIYTVRTYLRKQSNWFHPCCQSGWIRQVSHGADLCNMIARLFTTQACPVVERNGTLPRYFRSFKKMANILGKKTFEIIVVDLAQSTIKRDALHSRII